MSTVPSPGAAADVIPHVEQTHWARRVHGDFNRRGHFDELTGEVFRPQP